VPGSYSRFVVSFNASVRVRLTHPVLVYVSADCSGDLLSEDPGACVYAGRSFWQVSCAGTPALSKYLDSQCAQDQHAEDYTATYPEGTCAQLTPTSSIRWSCQPDFDSTSWVEGMHDLLLSSSGISFDLNDITIRLRTDLLDTGDGGTSGAALGQRRELSHEPSASIIMFITTSVSTAPAQTARVTSAVTAQTVQTISTALIPHGLNVDVIAVTEPVTLEVIIDRSPPTPPPPYSPLQDLQAASEAQPSRIPVIVAVLCAALGLFILLVLGFLATRKWQTQYVAPHKFPDTSSESTHPDVKSSTSPGKHPLRESTALLPDSTYVVPQRATIMEISAFLGVSAQELTAWNRERFPSLSGKSMISANTKLVYLKPAREPKPPPKWARQDLEEEKEEEVLTPHPPASKPSSRPASPKASPRLTPSLNQQDSPVASSSTAVEVFEGAGLALDKSPVQPQLSPHLLPRAGPLASLAGLFVEDDVSVSNVEADADKDAEADEIFDALRSSLQTATASNEAAVPLLEIAAIYKHVAGSGKIPADRLPMTLSMITAFDSDSDGLIDREGWRNAWRAICTSTIYGDERSLLSELPQPKSTRVPLQMPPRKAGLRVGLPRKEEPAGLPRLEQHSPSPALVEVPVPSQELKREPTSTRVGLQITTLPRIGSGGAKVSPRTPPLEAARLPKEAAKGLSRHLLPRAAPLATASSSALGAKDASVSNAVQSVSIMPDAPVSSDEPDEHEEQA